MERIAFGKTEMAVSRAGFGMLPLQRVTMEESDRLLRAAFDGGITFFDTARAYTDSEARFGRALSPVRDRLTLATKTQALTAQGFAKDLETSLGWLRTDCIDIYQFHNPPFVPVPGGEDGLYDAALAAKRAGKIRHIAITNHSLERAFEAAQSGLYASVQYPFNHLATKREAELVELCEQKGVGFIAMKAMSGGLISDARLPYAYLGQFPGVVPIWGIQRQGELEEIFRLYEAPPELDEEAVAAIARDRAALAGSFCRSCGYCLPCPVGIPISDANRMTQLLTRSPSAQWLTKAWQEKMSRVEKCTRCGACAKKCPYELKPYETMPEHLEFYREYLKGRG